MIAYLFQKYPENFAFQVYIICSNLPVKFAIFLVSIVFFVNKQNVIAQ